MAVTVRIDDKKKAPKRAPGVAAVKPADLDDYTLPLEKKDGVVALAIWIGIMIAICGPGLYSENTQPIAEGLFAWWFFSAGFYLFGWPYVVLRRLRAQGASGEISASSNSRLFAVMQKGAGVLGLDAPDGFLDAQGSPRVLGVARSVVLRGPLEPVLEPDELNCLAVRVLVTMRQRQARRFLMLRLLDDTPRAARLLAWPVVIYELLLRGFWLGHAHQTADRLALLLVKNHRLLISAILKEYAANDPNMREMQVSSADVTKWINQDGHIGMAGEEISTQYKLGRAIHEDPALEERLQALQKWAESDEFKAALAKLAEARAGRASGG